ncbi:M14 family zinc carboxypeptidase [Marinicella litoralis]|uniref:Immune inhibitor A peptidase M6 n=1 Tax=Marinicella litoralis TaxID=644220 RepID=A0A4R6XF95_9GAMM|nr:M14 family zinc carboxypeptidase [Marinicella litoralis]TDR16354.1 immune inhibitor A peptidase M6 [Marinicella litoralis]
MNFIKVSLVVSMWMLSFVGLAFDDQRLIVDVKWTDEAQLIKLADQFDHFKLDKKHQTMGLEIDGLELQWLKDQNFQVTIDADRTEQLQQNLNKNSQAQSKNTAGAGIPGFECYRTVEETFATAMALEAAYPNLVSWTDEGDSWEKTQNQQSGYDLNVLVITNEAMTDDKPPLFITSGVHAREYANAELITRFAEYLVHAYGNNPDATWIIDHHEIHLLLQANPDGRKKAETGLSWRKNTNNAFCPNSNTRGIDLNRNFDFFWGCCGGSNTDPCSLSFRGPSAASEPEAAAIQSYMNLLFTDFRDDDLISLAPDHTAGIYLDIHSYGEVILSSWGFSTDAPPNGDGILSLARKFAFFNNYAPQLGSLGTVDGATKDYAYGRFGVPGYTFELGTSFFEDCGTFENSMVEPNINALIYAAKASRQPYTISQGPDVTSLQPFATPYSTGDIVNFSLVADDQRYVNGNGTEPTQNISQAHYSINTPPWDLAATTIDLLPSDGVLDSPQESFDVSIDTSGMSIGQHLLYFRAKDANDNWGAVSALFLDLVDPQTSPHIQGVVRDINTLAPIVSAQVSINSYQVQTDVQGAYDLQVPAGQYALQVSAAGYLSTATFMVDVTPAQTSQNDFNLVPLVEIYADDGENGDNGWTAPNGWVLAEELAFSPSHAWSDSVGGNYPDNADNALTSPTIDLTGINDATLNFRHRYQFESTYDFGHVEISADDGASWSELQAFTGNSPTGEWPMATYSLSALNDSPTARIRFRVTSDSSVTRDGWYIDDVSVIVPFVASVDLIFIDGFD